MSEKYWGQRDAGAYVGAKFALRASLAWDLVRHFGVVTGKDDGEDRAGRARLSVMPPAEVVERAFAIADRFVEAAEARGELAAFGPADEEAAWKRAGELSRTRSRAEFPRSARLLEEQLEDSEAGGAGNPPAAP